jgi:1-acyl-sn-glycerol-3-phosphate acyltransferase
MHADTVETPYILGNISNYSINAQTDIEPIELRYSKVKNESNHSSLIVWILKNCHILSIVRTGTEQAFEEGFDIAILPEGQLNPHPEEGLFPCFPGGFTLARMSKRPIQMMALHGTHKLWHAREDIGMTVTGRDVSVRVYPGGGRRYQSGQEFLATFEAMVGEFVADIQTTKRTDAVVHIESFAVSLIIGPFVWM